MQCFPPDARVPVQVSPSPNHGDRRGGIAPDMLILHYTGMADGEVALRRLCTGGTEVSAHYVVFEDGRIVQCVPEARRAWHAGEAFWAGIRDINSHSIGIEIVNPGHDNGYRDFPSPQIEAVIALCRDILARHAIRPERVLAHSDVAPARKRDPGEKFPWERLYRAGIGHWVKPAPITDESETGLREGDAGADVEALQQDLAGYGYGLQASGVFDSATGTVVQAFQRHFRPERIDGRADPSTRLTLRRLREAISLPAAV